MFSCGFDDRESGEGTGRKFLGPEELESLVKMIESTGTLRELNLQNVFSSCTDISRVLGALGKNASIMIFKSAIYSLYRPYWPDPTDVERTSLQNALLAMIRNATTLCSVTIYLYVNKEMSISENEAIQEAYQRPVLSFLYVQNRREKIIEFEHQVLDSILLNYQAANVLKIGRLLSGCSLVCGLRIPTELVDEILRQVTIESAWDDQDWRLIRRVAVDRRTVGHLLSND